jgi:hypothetical protein
MMGKKFTLAYYQGYFQPRVKLDYDKVTMLLGWILTALEPLRASSLRIGKKLRAACSRDLFSFWGVFNCQPSILILNAQKCDGFDKFFASHLCNGRPSESVEAYAIGLALFVRRP